MYYLIIVYIRMNWIDFIWVVIINFRIIYIKCLLLIVCKGGRILIIFILCGDNKVVIRFRECLIIVNYL